MKRVLAATDFSTRSHRAVRRAGVLARQAGAELLLLHIVDEDRPERLVQLEQAEAGRMLDEQLATMPELSGVTCRAMVLTGAAHEALARTAKDLDVDLIVMGLHRKQILRDTFIGTTVERVIRLDRLPVLVVNTEVTHRYAHILLAADLSDASLTAFQTAHALGLLEATRVSVMHAFEAVARPKMSFADVPEERIKTYVEEERQRAVDALTAFVGRLPFDTGAWLPVAVEGEPMPAISEAVQRLRPDLVVVGTHGRSGFVKFFLGSVTEEVFRKLEIDILAVNTGPARA